MSTQFDATVLAQISATLRDTSTDDVAEQVSNVNVKRNLTLADGEGENQAEEIWTKKDTLAQGGTTNFDLDALAANAFGNRTVDFKAVKALYIENLGDDGNIELDGNFFTDKIGGSDFSWAVQPGGHFFVLNPTASGWGVASGTNATLTLTHDNSGSGGTAYRIVIIGTK